jgi:hypothetical protein
MKVEPSVRTSRESAMFARWDRHHLSDAHEHGRSSGFWCWAKKSGVRFIEKTPTSERGEPPRDAS